MQAGGKHSKSSVPAKSLKFVVSRRAVGVTGGPKLIMCVMRRGALITGVHNKSAFVNEWQSSRCRLNVQSDSYPPGRDSYAQLICPSWTP